MTSPDASNGYEPIAAQYIAGRGSDPAQIGATELTAWGRTFSPGAAILDLGCGTGVPISLALMNCGLNVHGVDASPTMVSTFHERFPDVPVQCATVEQSDFFGRSFDGIVAWGLMFLLTPDPQRALIAKVAAHLSCGGKFVFTAPWQVCTWRDLMTGLESVSLGREAYTEAIEHADMKLLANHTDAGENYYWLVEKP